MKKTALAAAMLLVLAAAARAAPPSVSAQIAVRLIPGTQIPDSATTALLACFDTVSNAFQYASTTYPCQTSGGSGGGSGTTGGTVQQGNTTLATGVAGWYVSDAKLEALISGSGLNVNVTFPTSQAVTGTFYQTTQPVSAASLPLPTGAATSANQPALNADGGANTHILNTVPVTGTFYQTTQPVSAASLPLPSGAATAANQPALNADGGANAHITNTVPVTGTFYQTTQPVSAAALPLPTGAATAANQVPADATSFTDANRLPVSQPDNGSYTGSIAAAGAIVNTPTSNPYFDTAGFQCVQVQVTSQGTGNTEQLEQSNDNATWVQAYAFSQTGGLTGVTYQITNAGLYDVPVSARYFRLRVSTYGSGTVSLVGFGRTANCPGPIDPQTTARNIAISGNANLAITASIATSATAGTSSQLLAAGAVVKGFTIQNEGSAAIFWNNSTVTGTLTAANSQQIPAGAAFTTPDWWPVQGAIEVASTTAVSNQVTVFYK